MVKIQGQKSHAKQSYGHSSVVLCEETSQALAIGHCVQGAVPPLPIYQYCVLLTTDALACARMRERVCTGVQQRAQCHPTLEHCDVALPKGCPPQGHLGAAIGMEKLRWTGPAVSPGT